MIDALGAPAVGAGARRDLGHRRRHLARFAAAGRLRRAVLPAREPTRSASSPAQARALGVADVVQVPLEARDPDSVEAAVSAGFAGGDIDVVLVAFGVLPDQRARARATRISRSARRRSTSSARAWPRCTLRMRCARQGHGVLVVLSSAAAERPRRSNFVYGATKAGGLDALCTGLGDSTARHRRIGRGGSAGLRPDEVDRAPAARAPGDRAGIVAEAIATHLTAGSRTVWVPRQLRAVMSALRHLPRPVFRRLPL